MLEIGVGRDEHLESLSLGNREQLAVLQRRPASFVGGRYLVLGERFSQWIGCALIEQYAHLHGDRGATGSVIENGANLFRGYARKPLDKL